MFKQFSLSHFWLSPEDERGRDPARFLYALLADIDLPAKQRRLVRSQIANWTPEELADDWKKFLSRYSFGDRLIPQGQITKLAEMYGGRKHLNVRIFGQLSTLSNYLAKLESSHTPEQVNLARSRYLAIENAVTNVIPQYIEGEALDIRYRVDLEDVRYIISAILGSEPPDQASKLTFGPGVSLLETLGTTSRNPSVKMKNIRDHLIRAPHPSLWDAVPHFDTEDRTIQPIASYDFQNVPAKLAFVPKDYRGPRSISIEPCSTAYLQQVVRHLMLERMRVSPFWPSIDIEEGQAIQQNRIRNDDVSTIDLADASDYLSEMLIAETFPIPWLELLNKVRSPLIDVGLGDNSPPIRLRKYGGMGNATVFPVQTIMYYALLSAAKYAGPGERLHVIPRRGSPPALGVYGDDIVLPRKYALAAIQILEEFGLRINYGKSFPGRGQVFRESCGLDWHYGPVTPVRRRRVSQWDGPAAQQVSCAHLQVLTHAGFHTAAQVYLKGAPHYIQKNVVPSSWSGALGVPGGLEPMIKQNEWSWDDNTQTWTVTLPIVRAKTKSMNFYRDDRLYYSLLLLSSRDEGSASSDGLSYLAVKQVASGRENRDFVVRSTRLDPRDIPGFSLLYDGVTTLSELKQHPRLMLQNVKTGLLRQITELLPVPSATREG